MKKNTNGTKVLSKERLVAEALGARIQGGRKAAFPRYKRLMCASVPTLNRIIARERQRIQGQKDTRTCLATFIGAANHEYRGDVTTQDIAIWADSYTERRLGKAAVAWMTAHFAS